MPLTDPQPNQQFWPPQGAFAQAQDYRDQRGAEAYDQLIKQLLAAHQQLAYAVSIQREALCRVLGIEEATLLAAEKAIHQERNRPAPEVTAAGVEAMVHQAIERNNEVVRNMLHEFATSLRGGPETVQDPMTHDDLPPALEGDEDEDAIEMN